LSPPPAKTAFFPAEAAFKSYSAFSRLPPTLPIPLELRYSTVPTILVPFHPPAKIAL
jgi:hypothetical protein